MSGSAVGKVRTCAVAAVAVATLCQCGGGGDTNAAQSTPTGSSTSTSTSAAPVSPPPTASVTPSGGRTTAAVRGLPPSQITIGTTRLASGLGRLTAMAAPDDGSGRLLVAEKSGTLRVFRPGHGMDQGNYLDIRSRVSTDGNERGLVGVATSPDFATTHTLVVVYTRRSDQAVTLSRFRLPSADVTSVAPDSEQVVLTQQHAKFPNHNGGQVTFGPDRLLYWGVGDGGGAGDPLGSGQSLTTLLGKVMRVDVLRDCDGHPYCVPDGNPFIGKAGARPEIWAYGLRNPWRFSFDRADGSLWIADVGQNAHEEVDHLTQGQGGVNFGWSCREGTATYNEDRCGSGKDFTDPVFSYRNGEEGCAVMGGFVYRGDRFASVAGGTYVLGDYCSATAWGVQADGSKVATAKIGSLPAQPTTFAQDQAGELYLATDAGELHQVTFRRR